MSVDKFEKIFLLYISSDKITTIVLMCAKMLIQQPAHAIQKSQNDSSVAIKCGLYSFKFEINWRL